MQRGLRGLLCRWPSITEREMYITAQGLRLLNDLFVSSGTLNSNVPYLSGLALTAPAPAHLVLHVNMYIGIQDYNRDPNPRYSEARYNEDPV